MKVLFYGFIAGIIVPIVGVLVFLNLSPVLGDVLLMPMYILSGIFSEPFWYLSLVEQVSLFVLCGVFYSFFIGLIGISPNLNN